jgi:hypothetical protein
VIMIAVHVPSARGLSVRSRPVRGGTAERTAGYWEHVTPPRRCGPPELDQEWIKTTESSSLKRPKLAEGAGFEPAEPVKARWFSRPVLSTAQPPLRGGLAYRLTRDERHATGSGARRRRTDYLCSLPSRFWAAE